MARTVIRLKKALTLARRKGLLKGFRESLGHWAADRFRISADVFEDLSFVYGEDHPANLPFRNSELLTIHWVIPQFALGSGGHHNIFSTIAELEQKGHRN